jgi:ATP-dependent helicase/nuclease subunit A
MPPFEFYARVLGPGNGRRKLLARLGREAEDPIAEFLDMAQTFERTHAASLEGFLHWLEAGSVQIKRDLEQEEHNAVRVMTVHGAKGLQAPIVFLPDTMQAPTQSPRLLWPPTSDNDDTLFLWPPSREFYDEVAEAERARLALRQRQEYRRLLYVAMTRAEDRLIVCGWKNPKRREPADCWYHLIHNALRSDASDDTQEIDDPFLARSEEIDDSRVLRLSCPQEVEKPGTRPMAIQDTRPLPEWAARPPAPEPEPPLPLTPSRPEGDEPPVRSPMGADNGRRFKRGRLIHRLLQSLPELDRERRSEAARAWLSRPAHDLATEEQDEIVAEVAQVLEHPEFAPLFGPGSRAEVPLTGQVEGRVISGQVDRLLVTPESVVVLDYKTDRPAPKNASGVPSIYLKQMAAYRAALRLIYPRQPIRCVLLWTDEPRLMTLADTLLDGHAP